MIACHHKRRPRIEHRTQDLAPLAQGKIEEPAAIRVKHVERDVDRCTEPRLETPEVRPPCLVKDDDLAVEDHLLRGNAAAKVAEVRKALDQVEAPATAKVNPIPGD